MLPVSEEARLIPAQSSQSQKAISQIKFKQLHYAANENKEALYRVSFGQGQRPAAHQKLRRPEPISMLKVSTHRCTQASSCCSFSAFLSLLVVNLTFLLAPALWSGLLERALVTGAGTGESRSVWLWRTALAQGLISGPSTLPTLSTQAHTRTHTCKVKHCPLCPRSAAVTRPARFGG